MGNTGDGVCNIGGMAFPVAVGLSVTNGAVSGEGAIGVGVVGMDMRVSPCRKNKSPSSLYFDLIFLSDLVFLSGFSFFSFFFFFCFFVLDVLVCAGLLFFLISFTYTSIKYGFTSSLRPLALNNTRLSSSSSLPVALFMCDTTKG